MDSMLRLRVFAKVAEHVSFSAAARDLGLVQSQVSRGVRELEDELRCALVSRTTRVVALTAEGERYLEEVRAVLARLDLAADQLREARAASIGRLRITAPAAFGAVLGPLLADLARTHRQLAIETLFTDRRVALVADGYDVALRVGPLASTELVCRRIGTAVLVAYASPAYVAERGDPLTPEHLVRLVQPWRHDLAAFLPKREAERIALVGPDHRRTTLSLAAARLASNDLSTIIAAAVRGAAIAWLPASLARDHVAAGRLVRVLDGWTTEPSPIHALYARRSPQPQRVRLFIDAAREALTPPGAGSA